MMVNATVPFRFEPFDPANRGANLVVLGCSGSGKTSTAKAQILAGQQTGVISYVINSRGEYNRLARELGGQILSVGAPGQGLNPFEAFGRRPRPNFRAVHLLRELIARLTELPPGREVSTALDSALGSYVASSPNQLGLQGFYHWLQANGPLSLDPFVAPLVNGAFPFLSPEPTEFPQGEEPPLTVFDLSWSPPDQEPLAFWAAASFALIRASQNDRPRLLVIDEIGPALTGPHGGPFLVNLVQQSHNCRLPLVITTEHVSEFLARPPSSRARNCPGRSVLQNAGAILLLRQAHEDIPTLSSMYSLHQHTQDWLATCPDRTGLWINGSYRTPAAVEGFSANTHTNPNRTLWKRSNRAFSHSNTTLAGEGQSE